MFKIWIHDDHIIIPARTLTAIAKNPRWPETTDFRAAPEGGGAAVMGLGAAGDSTGGMVWVGIGAIGKCGAVWFWGGDGTEGGEVGGSTGGRSGTSTGGRDDVGGGGWPANGGIKGDWIMGEGGAESTEMTSFWPELQWWGMVQMNHLVPGVVNVMTSFPLTIGGWSFGAVHCENDETSTFNTLCFPFSYLNTTTKILKKSHIKKYICNSKLKD